jgi:hypothetical protein
MTISAPQIGSADMTVSCLNYWQSVPPGPAWPGAGVGTVES